MSISHEQQIRQQLQAKGYRVLELRTVEVDQRAGPIYRVSAEKADPVRCGNLIRRHSDQDQLRTLRCPRMLSPYRPSPPAMIATGTVGRPADR